MVVARDTRIDAGDSARHRRGCHAVLHHGRMGEVVRVVAAVIVDEGRVLVCRRAAHVRDGGVWEFPGGKIEPGESATAALVREIREELGVGIEIGALVDRSTTAVGDRSIDLACYLARLLGPRPARSTDHDLLDWVDRRELVPRAWAAPDLPAVDLLRAEVDPFR